MEQLNLIKESGESLNVSTRLFDYRHAIFTRPESNYFLNKFIKEVSWSQKANLASGDEIITPRLTAWFGDPGTDYSYSGNKSTPFKWTKELLQIKDRIEILAGTKFNGVLLNYYRDGNDSVNWHSDGDGVPGRNRIVASVSFGEERLFEIRNTYDPTNKFSILLENGSYFLMKGDFQENWQHRISKSEQATGSRINLTFRKLFH